jgi:hypothetical protein
MPTCFRSSSGSIVPDTATITNADGSTTAAPRTDFAQCEFVMLGGPEYGNWQQLINMTPDEASSIGLQIGVVWAIAYGFKLIRRALPSWGSEEE